MIGVIFNPTARGNQAARFRNYLAGLGRDVRLRPTRHAGDARGLAVELVANGCDRLVAAGGDGTVNEVLNGLCDAPDGLARARLGVIPLGTINVFAKELKIPGDFAGAWQIIRDGRERLIDLPVAEFTGLNGEREQRHFILMAGAGLDARAISLVNWELKKRFGPLAYIWAGVRAMRRPLPQITVDLGGQRHTVELAEVGNGRFYGGKYPVFPHAQLADGEIDVTLFPEVTWLTVVRVFLRLLADRLATSPDAVLKRGRELQLSALARQPFHLDGDVVGELPATITLRPRALRVLVP